MNIVLPAAATQCWANEYTLLIYLYRTPRSVYWWQYLLTYMDSEAGLWGLISQLFVGILEGEFLYQCELLLPLARDPVLLQLLWVICSQIGNLFWYPGEWKVMSHVKGKAVCSARKMLY